MTDFFKGIEPIRYEGPDSTNPMAFRHYDPDEMVMGKRLEDHLRFAVAWWHSFAWPGGDPFGGQTFERPWFGDTMDHAKMKADVAFEMFSILGQPFFCFHDADIRPEGDGFAGNTRNLEEMVDQIGTKMEEVGTKLLWGTANLFTNRRYMAGASTNPDPDVFAFAAATVKTCMDIVSGAGHDACWINRVAPTAMVMCPCVDGLSHNEAEEITKEWAKAGADVLFHAVVEKAEIVG